MTETIEAKLTSAIRDIKDFPKEGIVFKDITPVLKDPVLCGEVVDSIVEYFKGKGVDAVAGIESRGFLFGVEIARKLNVPFVPVRKVGKLPYETISHKYELEYGYSEIEVHTDAFEKGQKVLIHDDLLATGGTAAAAAELVNKIGAEVAGFSFLIDLTFLKGSERLNSYSNNIQSLVKY